MPLTWNPNTPEIWSFLIADTTPTFKGFQLKIISDFKLEIRDAWLVIRAYKCPECTKFQKLKCIRSPASQTRNTTWLALSCPDLILNPVLVYLNWVDEFSFNLHDAGCPQVIWTEGESQLRLSLDRDLLQFKLDGGVVQDMKGWQKGTNDRPWTLLSGLFLMIK